MISAGIDAGMRVVKICLVDDETIIGTHFYGMDGSFKHRFKKILNDTVVSAKESGALTIKPDRIIVTGYGASQLPRRCYTVEENSCIAAVAGLLPYHIGTIIDAGGFFIKIYNINEQGRISGYITNDKCAAGGGRLLEIAADALNLSLDKLKQMDLSSVEPFNITGSCAVFAESEIISHIANGVSSCEIIAGVIRSLAAKTAALLENSRGKDPVAITGGLSTIEAFVKFLREISGREILTLPAGPQLSLAFGAALIGCQINKHHIFSPVEKITSWIYKK